MIQKKNQNFLPSFFPNLLVNGSHGIAIGYSTSIPTHNFKEVINALLFVLKNDKFSLNQLSKIIKGPDFPTGGQIYFENSWKNILDVGYGKIKIFAKYKISKK